MSTQMFFRSTEPTGVNDRWSNHLRRTNLAGSLTAIAPRYMSTSRGGAATSLATSTVTGPTSGVETISTAASALFTTPPLSADFTISGSITFNLRAAESSMSANVAINCLVFKVDGKTGELTQILKTANVTELGTSESANNFSASPTSTAFKRGDRVGLIIFGDDATGVNMATGFTFTFWFNGPTAAASGDSYATFTENLTFESAPSGTTVYPTTSASDISAPPTHAQTFGSNIEGWTRDSWTGYNNPADSISWQSADGNGANGCLEVSVSSSASDRSCTFPLPGKYKSGVTYQLSFYVKQFSGSGQLQWGIGSQSAKSDNRSTATGQTVTSSWVQKTLNWTPNADCTDACIWLSTWGGITSVLRYDDFAIDVAPNASGLEMWTSRGSGVVSQDTATLTEPRPRLQVEDGSNIAVEWVTKMLQAVTLNGPVLVNVRVSESNTAANIAPAAELALLGTDNSVVEVWARNHMPTEVTASEAAYQFWLTGRSLSVAEGQRLRLRLYHGGPAQVVMVSGHSGVVYYAGTSGGASGDTYLQFPVTLTEYTPPATDVGMPYVGGGYYA